ncbi:MAG: protein-L-isoaspartate(D-aspartate) O-methyltransferase [Acidobacteria bacterium]|nr:MAG: protein-L-isoaspartate(D-aspartate) O-methyltransferase [Acidobacteriota bacterium]PYU46558.1 MAG: protein-L-isoaspartate(D-aspartate) O-methyltransferase [Acidobacteriota bacterium]
MNRLEAYRHFYAELVTTSAGAAKNERLKHAFASTPRERFIGIGPWKVFARGNYVETPTDDPAFLYQDVVVALAPERRINNGEPSLHAISLAALNVKQGEKVLHVGAGTGYYTALLARLTGETGTVVAYEVEHDLAQNAIRNLSDLSNVTVQERSGSEAPLPACDAIYVNAGATAPLNVWLDALQLNGRLLFPLTPADGPGGMPGAGGMLLVTRTATDHFDARFVCDAMFVPCFGARDEETAQKLSAAFKRGDSNNVRTLRRNSKPDDTCWCAGNGWWLSIAD